MLILPAVDIRNGRCVRLLQGNPQLATVYEDDPLRAALRWQAEGSDVLHVVDLNGTIDGEPINSPHVRRIIAETGMKVELGGGIRSESDVETWIEAGVSLVVLGTLAVQNPDAAVRICRRWPKRIVIAVDAKDGKVVTHGWARASSVSVLEIAERFQSAAPAAFLYTDVAKDGMLSRPDTEGVSELVEATDIPVIASGGVSTLEDIKSLGQAGAAAAITGKALYVGRFKLSDAIKVAADYPSSLGIADQGRTGI